MRPLAEEGPKMTHYLIAIHHPDDFVPYSEDEQTRQDISALNEEMVAAGVRVFVCGLEPVRRARSIRSKDGKTFVSDGPYIEAKEHIGGFWVLDLASMDEAEAWGRKAALACRAPVEIRAFN